MFFPSHGKGCSKPFLWEGKGFRGGSGKVDAESADLEGGSEQGAEPRLLLHNGDIPLTVPIPSHSYTGQGGQESEDYESEEQLQHRILTAALEFVPEHGWTAEAIAEGAKVCGQRSAGAVEARQR